MLKKLTPLDQNVIQFWFKRSLQYNDDITFRISTSIQFINNLIILMKGSFRAACENLKYNIGKLFVLKLSKFTLVDCASVMLLLSTVNLLSMVNLSHSQDS